MAAASYDAAHVRPRHGGLGVHAASRKIGKPSSSSSQQQNRKPVIIYMVSPKVIHVEAHEFMSLVQRLTGPDGDGQTTRLQASASTTSSSSPRRKQQAGPPVRVKARALNRPGPAVSVSVTATRQQQAASWAGPSGPSASSGFLFRDLSPLRGGALKGEGPASQLVSPWLHHVGGGDHFLSPGAPSGFLDIFGPLSSSQHQ